jgi:hypothetical protein
MPVTLGGAVRRAAVAGGASSSMLLHVGGPQDRQHGRAAKRGKSPRSPACILELQRRIADGSDDDIDHGNGRRRDPSAAPMSPIGPIPPSPQRHSGLLSVECFFFFFLNPPKLP